MKFTQNWLILLDVENGQFQKGLNWIIHFWLIGKRKEPVISSGFH